MEPANDQTSIELLQAQTHVWSHLFNFINSMSLKCAVHLGIPDIIHNHGKPMTLPELLDKLHVHPKKAKYVYNLMCLLVQCGFFVERSVEESEREEGYVLTHASRLLLKDDLISIRPFLLCMLDPALTEPWHCMSAWFQNDDPTTFYTSHKQETWGFVSREPQFNFFFNEAMASDGRLICSILVKEGKNIFEGLNSLVDVAGGTGTVARIIADTFPHINCTVLDLPHVVSGLQGSHNLKFVAGDMFEAIPPADAMLLKWIAHNWRDEECVKILKRCREAIPSNGKKGKLIIIDIVLTKNHVQDLKTRETQLFFDMMMMVLHKAGERDEKEWERLLFDAGFSHYKIMPILGVRSLIEAYP